MSYTLSNKSGQNIQTSAVAITLPDDVTYSSSGSKPMGSAGTLVEGAVTWANAGAIKVGKSKTYMAAVTVRPYACMHAWLTDYVCVAPAYPASASGYLALSMHCTSHLIDQYP